MIVGATAGGGLGWAQPAELPEKPQLLALRIGPPTLGLDVEGQSFRTKQPDGSPASVDKTLDWTPLVGLQFEGSVYSPKLLELNLVTENGLTRGQRTVEDGTGQRDVFNRDFTIQRYNGTATLLRDKPYSVSLFGRKDREQRDYDQFNRFDADTQVYGASLQGSGRNWNWDVRASHSDEQVKNSDRPSDYNEKLLNADLQYRRSDDARTTLRYSDQDFRRQDDGSAPYDGVLRTVYLQDEMNFASNRSARLLSSLNFSDLNESLLDSRSLTLREDFRKQHRVNLWSGATYQYDYRETGGTRYDLQNGEIYAEHKLYRNLDSRLNAQGEFSNGSGDDYKRYGPGIAEHYGRNLGDIGRVGVDLDYRIDRIDRTVSGSAVTIIDETVRLTDGQPAFLSLPGVRADSIVVTDQSGAQRFLPGFDYRVISRGTFTEIQRTFGGSIPNGATVLVDYVSDSGGSESLTRQDRRAAFELDLYRRKLFLYVDNHAAESFGDSSLLYQDYRDTTAGVKSRWPWFEVGAEHVDHSAESLSYDGFNYYAELFWDGELTSIKLHAGRSDLNYSQQEGRYDTRTYTATLDYRPVSMLTLEAFAGEYNEFTRDGERDLLTLEGRAVFRLGKLSLDGTFRQENETLVQEKHDRQYLLVKLRREF